MSHLAAFLRAQGNIVLGCDVEEDFFTAPILAGIKINSFDDELSEHIDALIYSGAYNDKLNVINYCKLKGVPIYSYPEFLALLSKGIKTYGVSGTHGKTTTTAYTSYLLKSLSFKGGAIFGSFLLDLSIYNEGKDALVIEACEYKNHFNLYQLAGLVITNIDFDHPDYFKTLDDVKESFHQRFLTLGQNGVVICHSSAYNIVSRWVCERPDIKVIVYSKGKYSVINSYDSYEVDGVKINTGEKNHLILDDIVAAMLLSAVIILRNNNKELSDNNIHQELIKLASFIPAFPGVASRGEVVQIKNNITFISDYAHHPNEIKTCIDNTRQKYPSSRIIVLFMPHTATRTKALLKDFASALSLADDVFIQNVYSSARHDEVKENLSLALTKEIEKKVFRSFLSKINQVVYIKDDDSAVDIVSAFLLSGDVCITMGAGNNRKLIKRIIDKLWKVWPLMVIAHIHLMSFS